MKYFARCCYNTIRIRDCVYAASVPGLPTRWSSAA